MKVFSANEDNIARLLPLLESKHCFVKFYSRGCGHCRAMAKDWNIMIGSFLRDRSLAAADGRGSDEIVIAEVDPGALKLMSAGVKDAVNGFPTILELKNGRIHSTYGGDRTAADLKQWIRDNGAPSAQGVRRFSMQSTQFIW